MATRLIKQRDLEVAFPNEIQRKAFLDMMSDLIMVEPEEELSLQVKAICAIMIETKVKMGIDYGKLHTAYPTAYGAGCLIDGLRNQGFEIVKK